MHQAIKRASDDWWHEFSDAWIVKSSHSPAWWRERLEVLFGFSGQLFIMELPTDVSDRDYSGILRETSASTNWFQDVYREKQITGDPWGHPAITTATEDDELPF